MITSQQMKELELFALSKDISLAKMMENAGRGAYKETIKRFDLSGKRIVLFCGPGNNGGDGLVAARYFHENNHPVIIFLFGDKDNLSEESLDNYNRIKKEVNIICIHSKEEMGKFKLQKHLEFVLVDALLGIGIKGIVREPLSSAIDMYNSIPGQKVSVDVPSGMNADTGEVAEKCCESDLIVTFHDLKVGLEKMQKKCVVVDVGIPKK
ncbi:MAG: NAD(P)H-hydrate epimerase [Candidatus Woesearchaeota archaeon]